MLCYFNYIFQIVYKYLTIFSAKKFGFLKKKHTFVSQKMKYSQNIQNVFTSGANFPEAFARTISTIIITTIITP